MTKVNPLNLLKQDHAALRGLLDALDATTTRAVKRRRELLEQLAADLKLHQKLEDEHFYPAFFATSRKKEDQDLYHEARQEHHVVELLLGELETTDPATPEFGAKCRLLKELVGMHLSGEEREIFKALRRDLAKEEFDDLGARLEQRKAELLREQRAARRRPEEPLLSP